MWRRLAWIIFGCLAISLRSLADPAEAAAFAKRLVLTYGSKENPKAAGANITLNYPNTWIAHEGRRPHVVQLFRSGTGTEICTLLIVPMDHIISEAEAREAFQKSNLKDYAPEGARFLSGQPTAIDGSPAAIINYKQTSESAGKSLTVYGANYITFYGKNSIQLGCAVNGLEDTVALAEKFLEYSRSLFFLIANSVVLQDKWTDAVK